MAHGGLDLFGIPGEVLGVRVRPGGWGLLLGIPGLTLGAVKNVSERTEGGTGWKDRYQRWLLLHQVWRQEEIDQLLSMDDDLYLYEALTP